MKFSIRELIVLTAYAALLVTNHKIISVLLITACVSATLMILILFGITSLREFRRGKHGGSRSFLVPFGLLAFCLILPSVIAVPFSLFFGLYSIIPYCLAASGAMLLGAASASVPLLAMFESRFPVINRELLWLGYWSLLGGGLGGIFGLIVANTLVDLANRSSNELALRMCVMGGLFLGMATNWLKSPRTSTNPFGEEYNDHVNI